MWIPSDFVGGSHDKFAHGGWLDGEVVCQDAAGWVDKHLRVISESVVGDAAIVAPSFGEEWLFGVEQVAILVEAFSLPRSTVEADSAVRLDAWEVGGEEGS